MMRELVLCALLLFAAMPSVAAQETPCATAANILKRDGECWRTMSVSERGGVIRGIWVADSMYETAVGWSGQQTPSFFFRKNYLEMPPSTTIGDITSYFNLLYETPANRQIEWGYAYLLALMRARDDDSDDRLSLVNFLRSAKSVPAEGARILSVSERLELRVRLQNGYETKFSLAGVSIKGMSADSVQRARKFLQSFMDIQHLDCSGRYRASLQLTFSTDMFRGSELSGDMTFWIGGSPKFCGPPLAGSVATSIFRTHQETQTSLVYQLVRLGLVQVDDFIDPKWGEEGQSHVTSMREYQQMAKDEGLYIHGKKTHKAVEALIR
jgi:hypothetical protein